MIMLLVQLIAIDPSDCREVGKLCMPTKSTCYWLAMIESRWIAQVHSTLDHANECLYDPGNGSSKEKTASFNRDRVSGSNRSEFTDSPGHEVKPLRRLLPGEDGLHAFQTSEDAGRGPGVLGAA